MIRKRDNDLPPEFDRNVRIRDIEVVELKSSLCFGCRTVRELDNNRFDAVLPTPVRMQDEGRSENDSASFKFEGLRNRHQLDQTHLRRPRKTNNSRCHVTVTSNHRLRLPEISRRVSLGGPGGFAALTADYRRLPGSVRCCGGD